MTIHNQWKGGITNLVLPPIPSNLAGISGCQLFNATFDSAVREEAYLLILDTDSEWDETLAEKCELFRRPKSLRLHALTGAVEDRYTKCRVIYNQESNGFCAHRLAIDGHMLRERCCFYSASFGLRHGARLRHIC